MKWIKHYDPSELLATIVGIFGGLGTISFITYVAGYPLLIASLGASSVLLYGVPGSPLAQPKNLFGGHLIASVVGVTCYHFCFIVGCGLVFICFHEKLSFKKYL